MRKILFLVLFTISFISIYAQDKIVKLNGETIICKVSEITENNIKFRYEGEEVLNSVFRNNVQEIVFNSGRIQRFSERIIINGESDWEKVKITKLESDIIGLKRIRDVSGKASSGAPTNLAKIQTRAMDNLRKESAKRGCHIVLILTESSVPGGWGPSGGSTKASYIGVAYSY